MRGVIFGVLGGVCALAAIVFLAGPGAPSVPFTTTLGAPGPQDAQTRSPGLAMGLAFSGDGSRVIAQQENGEIVAWGLASGAPHRLGHTTGPFAYCARDEVLLTSDGGGVTLTSLRDGHARSLGQASADYAAMSEDCATLAVAAKDATRISAWRLSPGLRFLPVETQRPIRNGLAISPDGARLAAATGTYSDEAGHVANLEVFAIPPWGPDSAGPLVNDELIVGMWRVAFSPDGALLYAGSQSGGKAGLRAFSSVNGAAQWGYDGFKAFWVRGLAISQDGAILATGDENGMLRLWDGATGELLYEGWTGLPIQSLAFSPDGSMLAVGLWDATIGVAGVWGLITPEG
jgi:WD40 repeat protein